MGLSQEDAFELFKQSRLIDLSMTYKQGMRGFNARVSVKSDGLNAHTYEIYSHAGTHLDCSLSLWCK